MTNQPTPILLNMVSFDLHYKEGLDLALQNISLLSEVTGKTEDKIKDRVNVLRNRIQNLNDVLNLNYVIENTQCQQKDRVTGVSECCTTDCIT